VGKPRGRKGENNGENHTPNKKKKDDLHQKHKSTKEGSNATDKRPLTKGSSEKNEDFPVRDSKKTVINDLDTRHNWKLTEKNSCHS